MAMEADEQPNDISKLKPRLQRWSKFPKQCMAMLRSRACLGRSAMRNSRRNWRWLWPLRVPPRLLRRSVQVPRRRRQLENEAKRYAEARVAAHKELARLRKRKPLHKQMMTTPHRKTICAMSLPRRQRWLSRRQSLPHTQPPRARPVSTSPSLPPTGRRQCPHEMLPPRCSPCRARPPRADVWPVNASTSPPPNGRKHNPHGSQAAAPQKRRAEPRS